MLQNQTNPASGKFPQSLLMNFTVPTRIQESFDETPIYDEINQVVYNMRTVGTSSLKQHVSVVGKQHLTDKKNEIDDQKNVK